MSTPRPRPSTQPHRDRDRTPRTPRDRERNAPPLPTYQPSIAPLTTAGHNAVLALLKTQTLRHLKTHLQHAGMKLTDAAGEVNERVTDARGRFQKQRERRERVGNRGREGDGEGNQNECQDGDREEDEAEAEEGGEVEEERNRLTSLEERVSGITKRLEEQVRKMVDAEAKVDSLVEVMGGFEKEADEASVARPGRRVTRGERRRRRRREEDEEGDGENDEDEDGDYEGTPESENDDGDAEAAAIAPPSRRLEESLNKSSAQWNRQSLTQRYSGNNTYIGFYRIVHEAQHPGNDIPPVPHASTWFSHLEDPNAAPSSPSPSPSTTTHPTTRQQHRRNNRSPSTASSSSDLAIESERLAPTCPLTLLIFRDPVTSTKCPHSFERDAIESMLDQSPTTVPAPPPALGTAVSRAARRIRSVKCPVCSVVLTKPDLRSDPVLLRRAKRYEARERERDDDDDDLGTGVSSSGRKRGRRSGIPVASDDDEGEGDRDRDDEDEDDEDEDGEDADERRQRKRQATEQVRIKQERAVSSSAPMQVD